MLPQPEMNITPLIDVLLVLLVLFILTVPPVTHRTALDLPQGGAAAAVTPVLLDIDFDGRMHWDGEPVANLAGLEQKLRALAQRSGVTRIGVDAVPD